jgi:hypothetical protein
MSDPEDNVIYRFTPQFDGAHMTGIPLRDLTQKDVDRLGPATMRRATAPHPGYGTPLYTAVEGKPKQQQEREIKAFEQEIANAEKAAAEGGEA